jgi:hypothetical protein
MEPPSSEREDNVEARHDNSTDNSMDNSTDGIAKELLVVDIRVL